MFTPSSLCAKVWEKFYNWYNNPKSNRTTPQLNKQNSSNGFQSFPLPKKLFLNIGWSSYFANNFLVDIRRRFNVYKTSVRCQRRRVDVLKTLKQQRVSTGFGKLHFNSQLCRITRWSLRTLPDWLQKTFVQKGALKLIDISPGKNLAQSQELSLIISNVSMLFYWLYWSIYTYTIFCLLG